VFADVGGELERALPLSTLALDVCATECRRPLKTPAVCLGHEFIGLVDAVGSDVQTVKKAICGRAVRVVGWISAATWSIRRANRNRFGYVR